MALKFAGLVQGCANCESVQSQLGIAQRGMKERDAMIKDLKSLCAKFEKQLSQQDVLLQQYNERGQRAAKLTK